MLLLDEPTVGVDPQLRATFWSYFRSLADNGVTLIVSSHVMDEANRCDRLVLLRDGTVLAQGSPAELLERTRTDDVEAAFLSLVAGGEPASMPSSRAMGPAATRATSPSPTKRAVEPPGRWRWP